MGVRHLPCLVPRTCLYSGGGDIAAAGCRRATLLQTPQALSLLCFGVRWVLQ